ncbi:unnamed protein product [Notodromas monacha]|uniref:Polypeptide N-acetylgalactosaminyltransferase n=1 Tax=Notodromas monacha TaxID=399045 RepID=A0A7R9BTP1_9CRUS|nr:unnamed protein product [Notodromas monacha]CAG0920510.1 unnamed protein product [Notodromas monacha]
MLGGLRSGMSGKFQSLQNSASHAKDHQKTWPKKTQYQSLSGGFSVSMFSRRVRRHLRLCSCIQFLSISALIWLLITLISPENVIQNYPEELDQQQEQHQMPRTMDSLFDGAKELQRFPKPDYQRVNPYGDSAGAAAESPVLLLEDGDDENKKPVAVLAAARRLRRRKEGGPDEDGGEGNLAPPEMLEHPGEMGSPVTLPSNESMPLEMRLQVEKGWQQNGFNLFVSDMISVRRTLPDVRHEACKKLVYPKRLPKASVILCFNNEAWSTLLRSVHSILDRTPEHLLQEILLVDDFSERDHLKEPLDSYMERFPKVKIVRLRRREGLIRARLAGGRVARGSVLVYLDSHIETTEGWMEPLLFRISQNWSNVVVPIIDIISDDTFEYRGKSSDPISVGGFDWSLIFDWHTLPERVQKTLASPIQPVPSPTMAGGLFAIDKKFFEHLGTYDEAMDFWGGENLELSFKARHIFRHRSPLTWPYGRNVMRKNTIRLAEVWLDEYKTFYYDRIGDEKNTDAGDLSSRKELRRRLKCKSFKWYLTNVYPEMFVPSEAVARGEVRNMAYGHVFCMDSPAKKTNLHASVGVYPCHRQGGNQYWFHTRAGEIRRDEFCLDYAGQNVMLYQCHGGGGNQNWSYNPHVGQLAPVIPVDS